MTKPFTVVPHAQPTADAIRATILEDPGFGNYFSDHMAHMRWTKEHGWEDGRVEPYGKIVLDPAAAVFHYAQEIFEGAKAYRHADGSVWGFRPEKNAARFQNSAERLALPQLAEDDFLESLRALVAVDSAWVPTPKSEADESSLYLRPFMIASETFLGVRASHEVDYYVIASPAGPYFGGAVKPVKIWLSRDYNRAGPGGTGAAKCGGNYAASLTPTNEAVAHGCQQVAFLDAVEGKYLQELGGMNIFLVYSDGRVVTPRLTDSILEGVTRSAILQLATDAGYTPEERDISIDEWREGARSGEITEAFACGTAAVVTPIGELVSDNERITHDTEKPGPVAADLRTHLLDIQYGRAEDKHGWLSRLA